MFILKWWARKSIQCYLYWPHYAHQMGYRVNCTGEHTTTPSLWKLQTGDQPMKCFKVAACVNFNSVFEIFCNGSWESRGTWIGLSCNGRRVFAGAFKEWVLVLDHCWNKSNEEYSCNTLRTHYNPSYKLLICCCANCWVWIILTQKPNDPRIPLCLKPVL
jgi:hypothetical protein